MAKTTRTAATDIPFELDKMLKVDGQDYNINAVHATQVDNKLIINEIDTDGKATPVEFNGSADTEISIVPSEGGKFSGPIKGPDVDLGTVDGATIINYGDTAKLLTTITGSGWYTWNEGTFEVVKKDNVSQHLGVVVGPAANVNSFAAYNKNNKCLPMYLYVSSDNGNLYYGTSEKTSATQIATEAVKLSNPQSIKVNLASTSQATLVGNATTGGATVTPGVSGTLPLTNGGTGGTTKYAAAYNIFQDLTHTDTNELEDDTKAVFQVSTPSTSNGVFYTKSVKKIFDYINKKLDTIGVGKGGTGKTSHTSNAVLTGNGTSAVKNVTTASGAFYATAANGAPTFGKLPIAQGGTNATTATEAITNIIDNNAISPSTVTVAAEKYMSNNQWGIDMRNSDIRRANGICFSDKADSGTEGLCFPRTNVSGGILKGDDTNWDRFYAIDGALWFAPNTSLSTTHSEATKYKMYHTGNLYLKSDSAPADTVGNEGDICIVY